MQRYFIKGTVSLNETCVMDDEHVHHIRNVMRAKAGDKFNVVDGEGNAYLVRLTDLEPVSYEAIEKIESEVELPVDITLYSPFLKGDKMDLVIQKSTELGVMTLSCIKLNAASLNWMLKKKEQAFAL
jgi:RNA methyltransferase, RsmE family